MRNDGRLPRMLHVLVHMALLGGRETSERISKMLNTNPVVVRRTLAALRDHGLVESEGGRGGGWKLTRGLDEMTVLDVHNALSPGRALAPLAVNDHPTCPVERASNAAIAAAFEAAEAQLLRVYGATPLSEISSTALGNSGQTQG